MFLFSVALQCIEFAKGDFLVINTGTLYAPASPFMM